MTLLVQDVMVTLFAAGALALLVGRVVSIVKPASGSSACGSCSSCAPQPIAPPRATILIPVEKLRRRETRIADAPPG